MTAQQEYEQAEAAYQIAKAKAAEALRAFEATLGTDANVTAARADFNVAEEEMMSLRRRYWMALVGLRQEEE